MLSVSLSLSLPVFIYVCLSLCLSICLSICLFLCLSLFVSLFPSVPLCLSVSVQMFWLSPDDTEHTVMWDASLCLNNGAGNESRRLMQKAFSEALVIHQQQQLLGELNKDPKLVYHIGLTPAKVWVCLRGSFVYGGHSFQV